MDTSDDLARRRQSVRAAFEARGEVLLPPMQEADLLSFENEYRVRLPDDLRTTLIEIGQVHPFLRVWHEPYEDWPPVVDAPCVLDPHTPFDDYKEDPARGAVAVYDWGACIYLLVIVTGANRGRVCWYNANLRETTWLTTASGKPRSLLEWMERPPYKPA